MRYKISEMLFLHMGKLEKDQLQDWHVLGYSTHFLVVKKVGQLPQLNCWGERERESEHCNQQSAILLFYISHWLTQYYKDSYNSMQFISLTQVKNRKPKTKRKQNPLNLLVKKQTFKSSSVFTILLRVPPLLEEDFLYCHAPRNHAHLWACWLQCHLVCKLVNQPMLSVVDQLA